MSKRKDVGVVSHIFTHLNHSYFIELIQLDSSCNVDTIPSGEGDGTIKWMSVEEMEEVGITTGEKKIFKLVEKGLKRALTNPFALAAKKMKS